MGRCTLNVVIGLAASPFLWLGGLLQLTNVMVHLHAGLVLQQVR